jgi:FixJ family two-component response regulator
MPGMDGVELVRHLGQNGYSGSVVVLSGEEARPVCVAWPMT